MEKKELYSFLNLGIIFFLFIEAFFNFVLHAHDLVAVKNLSNLEVALPWIVICLSIIFGAIFFSSFKRINREYKVYFLPFIIIGLRIVVSFPFPTELLLVFTTGLLTSILIYLTELFLLFRDSKGFINIQQIIGGIVLGIGIQLFFIIIGISSNLTTNLEKIPMTVIAAALLLFFNESFFRPSKSGTNNYENQEGDQVSPKKELNLFHFIFIGLIFYLSLNWTFNPMALAAYDKISLQFFSHSYLFYSLNILIAAVMSFFAISVLNNRKSVFKTTFLLVNFLYLGLNSTLIFILDFGFSNFAPLYLTILTYLGIFTMILDFSYLLRFYKLPSRYKTYLGLVLFLVTFTFLYAIQVIITWVIYLSFILVILILSISYLGFFLLLELRKVLRTDLGKNLSFKLKKKYIIFFLLILGMNLSGIMTIILFRFQITSNITNPTFLVWNIHNSIGLDGKFDLDRIVNEIRRYNPDVVGLNEVDMGGLKTSFVDMTAYIAHKLHMNYYYGPSFYKHYGNAILCKDRFLSVENFRLPRTSLEHEPRGVIRAKITINSEVWTVYVNHLHNKQDRLVQIPFIVSNLIEADTTQRVVWMGDFNAIPDSAEYLKINSTGTVKFFDTHRYLFPTPTNTVDLDENLNPTKRIDYILSSTDLLPVSGIVHISLSSDHCAVITRF